MSEQFRRSGQTTRVIDRTIQDLFTHGTVTVRDHFDCPEEHHRAYRAVVTRLQAEHRYLRFTADPATRTITIAREPAN